MDAAFFRVGLVPESIAQSALEEPESMKRWPMSWDFSTDPEYAEQLAWVEAFVREECEPLDLIIEESHDLNDPVRQALIPPLQQIVKERGLWATHLGPQLGGPGFGR